MNLKEQFEEFIHSRGFEDYEDMVDYIKTKRETRVPWDNFGTENIIDDLEASIAFLKKVCTGEY